MLPFLFVKITGLFFSSAQSVRGNTMAVQLEGIVGTYLICGMRILQRKKDVVGDPTHDISYDL